MKRIANLAVAALAALLVISAHAQTWYPVAPESTSTTLTIPAGTTYQLGTASCAVTSAAAWSAPVTVTAATTFNPLDWTNGVFPFADPCNGTLKTFQVQEVAATQALTLNGASFTVPALATVVAAAACPLPAMPNANPTLPATPPNCTLAANAQAIAGDGAVVTVLTLAAPVYFQYCQGQVCDAPFMFVSSPIAVGPNAQCGGPAGTGTGTLYALEGLRAVTLSYVAAGGAAAVPVAVPAGPGN